MAGFVDKFKRMWDAPDDEYEYDEYGYADEGAEEDYKEEPVRNTKKERDLGGGNKVVNINATTNLQVGLFKPERFGEETRTIAAIAMSYGYVYVAQCAMGADNNQVLKAMVEAESYNGPSLVICYAPCINHGIKGGMGIAQLEEKKAVEAGY